MYKRERLLPIIRIGGRDYFVDQQLGQVRAVNDICDRVDIEDFEQKAQAALLDARSRNDSVLMADLLEASIAFDNARGHRAKPEHEEMLKVVRRVNSFRKPARRRGRSR